MTYYAWAKTHGCVLPYSLVLSLSDLHNWSVHFPVLLYCFKSGVFPCSVHYRIAINLRSQNAFIIYSSIPPTMCLYVFSFTPLFFSSYSVLCHKRLNTLSNSYHSRYVVLVFWRQILHMYWHISLIIFNRDISSIRHGQSVFHRCVATFRKQLLGNAICDLSNIANYWWPYANFDGLF